MILGCVLDLWSKNAAFNYLEQKGGTVTIIDGFLSLVTAENTGAAFGIAAGQRYLLMIVSFVALAVILVVFFLALAKAGEKLMYLALGLFAAGVTGNLYDRLFNAGRVRDFIDVVYWPQKHWPAFNIADAMLCLAVALIIISTFFTDRPSRKPPQQHI